MEENQQEHFIKNIEIKNFKCFEDFKAEGFGRVNLIGGKNNVGKTAFMEAIYIDTSSNIMNNLLFSIANIERNRNKINDKETNIIDILTDYETFFIKGKNDIEYDVNLSGIEKHLKIKLNKNSEDIDFKSEINFISNEKVTFIDNYGFTNYELKSAFEAVQKKDKEDILDQYINQFDKNILKFKIIGGDKPQCRTSRGKYQDITKFGDGLKQYISIICSLYKSNTSYLYLDEIENGIHYTNLDKLWEVILTISKQQNVQVFATTHSKECIESFNRVQLKELEENKDTYYFEMAKNINTNEIFMSPSDAQQLEYELRNNERIRGE